ncbi:MAG: TadE/TadG family type IV pilus assembly protein [Alphaproteobacteria bacterium]
MMRLSDHFVRCLQCTRGAALTEFILIVPMMALMLAGVVEATAMLRLDRKLQNAAYATADLTTQKPLLQNTRLADIFSAADLVIQPYLEQGLSVGISSVKFDPDDGTPSVDWVESLRGGTVANAIGLAAGLGTPGSSVVIVRAQYTYTPLFGDLVFGNIHLEEVAFAHPRRSASIARE